MKHNSDTFNPFEFVPCHDAAAELRQVAGVFSLAPNTQALLAKLDACDNPDCPGTPRLVLGPIMVETVLADRILALQN